MSLDVLVEGSAGSPTPGTIDGVTVAARRIEGRAPAEVRTKVLSEASDWIVVPVLRRGFRQVNEIPAAVQSILGHADRPVLVVPTVRVEHEAEHVAAGS